LRARLVLRLNLGVPTELKKWLLLVVVPGVVLAMFSSALASPGDMIWVKRYDGPDSSTDNANAVAVSPDGTKIYVTGRSASSTTSYDYATVAYDAVTGARIWAKLYKGPGDALDEALAVAVSPDGTRVFVAGVSSFDYATVAYDASTGARIWSMRYDGAGLDDLAQAVVVSPDGTKVFVTGWSLGSAPTTTTPPSPMTRPAAQSSGSSATTTCQTPPLPWRSARTGRTCT
jgi:outer membrane protein assembly factor BamB